MSTQFTWLHHAYKPLHNHKSRHPIAFKTSSLQTILLYAIIDLHVHTDHYNEAIHSFDQNNRVQLLQKWNIHILCQKMQNVLVPSCLIMLIWFFLLSVSSTGTSTSLVGEVVSTLQFIQLGHTCIMITPSEKQSSLFVYLGGSLSASGGM